MRPKVAALLVVLACIAPSFTANGGGQMHPPPAASSPSHSTFAPSVRRDSHGKIARDSRALSAFKKQRPCPATGKTYGPCRGYVIDHVIELPAVFRLTRVWSQAANFRSA